MSADVKPSMLDPIWERLLAAEQRAEIADGMARGALNALRAAEARIAALEERLDRINGQVEIQQAPTHDWTSANPTAHVAPPLGTLAYDDLPELELDDSAFVEPTTNPGPSAPTEIPGSTAPTHDRDPGLPLEHSSPDHAETSASGPVAHAGGADHGPFFSAESARERDLAPGARVTVRLGANQFRCGVVVDVDDDPADPLVRVALPGESEPRWFSCEQVEG